MHKKLLIIYIVLIINLLAGVSLLYFRNKPTAIPLEKELFYIQSSVANSAVFAACAAWARLITANTDFIAVNSASPATMNEKIDSLVSGNIDLAIITGPSGYIAYNGHPEYWTQPQDIRALFGLWPAVYTGIAHEESGIKAIKDLKGKKVAIYSESSIDGNILAYLLELNGITGNNTTIYRVRESIGEKMFSRKEVDYILYNLGYGNSFLEDFNLPGKEDAFIKYEENYLYEKDKIIFIPFTENENLREFLSIYPVFYTEDFLFKNEETQDQLNTSNFIACSSQMSDELAYQLTRLWWENTDLIKQFTSGSVVVDSEMQIRKGLPVPLHPGAERFFDETGIPY